MTAIPGDVAREIGYDTCEEASRTWPRFEDRDGDIWLATPHEHDGQQVMWPCADDLKPLVRAEAEAQYGPLTPEQEPK